MYVLCVVVVLQNKMNPKEKAQKGCEVPMRCWLGVVFRIVVCSVCSVISLVALACEHNGSRIFSNFGIFHVNKTTFRLGFLF